MSNTKHTPGPLTYNQNPVAHRYNIEDAGGYIIASAYKEEDSARIVACVNACEGIADPEAFVREARNLLKHCRETRTTFKLSQIVVEHTDDEVTRNLSRALAYVENQGKYFSSLAKAEGK